MIEQQLSALITALKANTLAINTLAKSGGATIPVDLAEPDETVAETTVAPTTTAAPTVTTQAPVTTAAPEVTKDVQTAEGAALTENDVLVALRLAMASVQAAKPAQSQAETKATVMSVLVAASGGARKPGDVAPESRLNTIAGLTELANNPIA